jgi:hypothetical protein
MEQLLDRVPQPDEATEATVSSFQGDALGQQRDASAVQPVSQGRNIDPAKIAQQVAGAHLPALGEGSRPVRRIHPPLISNPIPAPVQQRGQLALIEAFSGRRLADLVPAVLAVLVAFAGPALGAGAALGVAGGGESGVERDETAGRVSRHWAPRREMPG